MTAASDRRVNWFEIDLRAISRNVAAVRRSVPEGVWFCVALKANAYGFGLVPVARAVLGAGVDALAVGSVTDGVNLRGEGVSVPILVYGGEPLGSAAVRELESHRLIATVHDAPTMRACIRSARKRLEVMVEVDVGLRRLGFHSGEVAHVVSELRAARALELRGIYTHMRLEARPDLAGMRKQFADFCSAVRKAGPVPVTMAASSRVLDRSTAMTLNAVDVGRAAYGLLPRHRGLIGSQLSPAFASLRSKLVTVKVVLPDHRTGDFRGVTRLGVIPFGRAAGMSSISTGAVLVQGKRARVLGTPSLEHTRIDLTRHATARVGDEVVLVGRQGAARISPDEVLHSHPELPDAALALQVGQSVERVYLD
jgi:alanine racemase